jgi:hypothetical protein
MSELLFYTDDGLEGQCKCDQYLSVTACASTESEKVNCINCGRSIRIEIKATVIDSEGGDGQ